MLDSFRDNIKGLGTTIVVGIMVIPFVFFGIDSLFVSGGSSGQVAEVNGEPVSELRLLQASELYKRQLLSQYQGIDPEMLDDEFLKKLALESLIGDLVVEQAARDSSMAVPLEQVYSLLVDVPAYQLDGEFSTSRYEYAIRQMGYTPTTHAQVVGGDILKQVFLQGPGLSGVATDAELAAYAALLGQQRDYYYLTIPADSVTSAVVVSEQDVDEYYQANSSKFNKPEQVRVEYVELRLEDLLDDVDVTQQELKSLYRQKQAEFSAAIQRQVAHILIEQDGDEAEERLGLVKQALAAGTPFADVVKKYSDDLGSVDMGGVLGYLSPGDLPESLDAALQLLEVGQVSEPVQSDAGLHVLYLMDVKQSEAPTFEGIQLELQQQLARDKATELYIQQVEDMQNEAYNAPSLADTAALVGASLQQSELFTRQGDEHPITGNLAVVKVAFSEEVLVEGYPSEVLELSDEHVVVLRVIQHQEATVAPLSEVSEQITQLVSSEKAGEQLQSVAVSLMTGIDAGETIESVAQQAGYDWQVGLSVSRNDPKVDREVRDFVFSLPVSEQQLTESFLSLNGDYKVVVQAAVRAGELSSFSKTQHAGMQAQLSAVSAARDAQNYQRLLIEQAEISK